MQPELQVNRGIYSKYFPRFDRPKIIGFIGLENLQFTRNIHNGKVNFDLNLLIDEAKRKNQCADVKLTDLINFLYHEDIRLNFPIVKNLDAAKFFCYRGLMTCVACTPFEYKDAWKIVAILHKGNIYLCARDTEEKRLQKENMSDREKQFTSWGFKFEQFLLSDSPNTKPNPNVPVDENKEFSLVFTTNLNKHTIVYGAEMDGVRCDSSTVPPPPLEHGTEAIIEYLSNKQFIELKTNRHIEIPKQEKSFRQFKTRKWWLQSFLVGVENIVCGCRNDDGIVEELKIYNLKDLVAMSKRFWDPNVCFNFLDTFFTYVKRCLAREVNKRYGETALSNLQTLPLTAIMFEWKPGMPVQVVENYVYEDDPILPEWFLTKGNHNQENIE